jgi:hypothetical protein
VRLRRELCSGTARSPGAGRLQRRAISDAFGLGLLLAPSGSPGAIANLSVSLCQRAPSRLEHAQLEALRMAIPAARGLPLLQQLALRHSGEVVLDYLDTAQLAVEIAA